MLGALVNFCMKIDLEESPAFETTSINRQPRQAPPKTVAVLNGFLTAEPFLSQAF